MFEVIDASQLKRIEATHRGFLYQHLYAADCLLRRPRGLKSVYIERDEDVELDTNDGRIYVQIKTRAENLYLSDLKETLSRFQAIRKEHDERRRAGKAEFWIVSNANISEDTRAELVRLGVEVVTPKYASRVTSYLPESWEGLEEGINACIADAGKIPYSKLTPETIVWKLAALVAYTATGIGDRNEHRIEVSELPGLLEQFVAELHGLPEAPVPYTPQDNEPEFGTSPRQQLIVGLSGAGKTAWGSHWSLHISQPVGYFDIAGLPSTAIAGSLVGELAAQFQRIMNLDVGAVLMPGSAGLQGLRALNGLIKAAGNQVIVVLDNVHTSEPAVLRQIVEAGPAMSWILLAQPWPGRGEIEAQFGIHAIELSGWGMQAIASEFSRFEIKISPTVAERVRTLTGGLPLFVKSAARLVAKAYQSDAELFCDELSAGTNLTETAQESILNRVVEHLTSDARHGLGIMALCEI